MTIEKEAREIALAIWGKEVPPHEYGSRSDRARANENLRVKREYTQNIIAKALQKKQDRIEELERKLAEYHDAYEGKKHRIYELESALKEIADSLTLTAECRALCEEMIPNALKDIDGIRNLAKKAIGDVK